MALTVPIGRSVAVLRMSSDPGENIDRIQIRLDKQSGTRIALSSTRNWSVGRRWRDTTEETSWYGGDPSGVDLTRVHLHDA